MQYKKGLFYFLCLVILAVSGCSSAPTKNELLDVQAKQFKTNAQKSNLYIYRNNTSGSSVKMQLEVDGQVVATSLGKTYIKLEVTPGRHKIVSYADNEHRLALATLKNKNYFIYQQAKMSGGRARTKLTLVRETVGKQGVQECKMISAIPLAQKVSMH